MTSGIELSVVIPARNAGALVEGTVELLANRLAGQRAELLVVENASTDDTFERCRRLAERWSDPTIELSVLRSEAGMGNALRTGALASRGAAVLLTADDLPFGTDDLAAADQLRAEADGVLPPVIIGSKAHPDSRVNRGVLRALFTRGYATLRRVVLGMQTGDPQGTFIVEGALLRQLAPHLVEPGFLFTTELAYVAELLGIPPVEVPVSLRAGHGAHKSRVSIADAVTMAGGLRRLRRRHRTAWRARSPIRSGPPKVRLP